MRYLRLKEEMLDSYQLGLREEHALVWDSLSEFAPINFPDLVTLIWGKERRGGVKDDDQTSSTTIAWHLVKLVDEGLVRAIP